MQAVEPEVKRAWSIAGTRGRTSAPSLLGAGHRWGLRRTHRPLRRAERRRSAGEADRVRRDVANGPVPGPQRSATESVWTRRSEQCSRPNRGRVLQSTCSGRETEPDPAAPRSDSTVGVMVSAPSRLCENSRAQRTAAKVMKLFSILPSDDFHRSSCTWTGAPKFGSPCRLKSKTWERRRLISDNRTDRLAEKGNAHGKAAHVAQTVDVDRKFSEEVDDGSRALWQRIP